MLFTLTDKPWIYSGNKLFWGFFSPSFFFLWTISFLELWGIFIVSYQWFIFYADIFRFPLCTYTSTTSGQTCIFHSGCFIPPPPCNRPILALFCGFFIHGSSYFSELWGYQIPHIPHPISPSIIQTHSPFPSPFLPASNWITSSSKFAPPPFFLSRNCTWQTAQVTAYWLDSPRDATVFAGETLDANSRPSPLPTKRHSVQMQWSISDFSAAAGHASG